MQRLFSFESLEKSKKSHRKILSRAASATKLRHSKGVSSRCSPLGRSQVQCNSNVQAAVSSLFQGVNFAIRTDKGFGQLSASIIKALYVGKDGRQDISSQNALAKLQILEHIRRLFPELTINQSDLWICREAATQDYIVYFSHSFYPEGVNQLLPLSRCCNQPLRVSFGEPGRVECLKCGKNLGEFVLLPPKQYNESQAKQVFTLLTKKRQEACQEISRCINTQKKASFRRIYERLRPIKILKSGHGTVLVKLYAPTTTLTRFGDSICNLRH